MSCSCRWARACFLSPKQEREATQDEGRRPVGRIGKVGKKKKKRWGVALSMSSCLPRPREVRERVDSLVAAPALVDRFDRFLAGALSSPQRSRSLPCRLPSHSHSDRRSLPYRLPSRSPSDRRSLRRFRHVLRWSRIIFVGVGRRQAAEDSSGLGRNQGCEILCRSSVGCATHDLSLKRCSFLCACKLSPWVGIRAWTKRFDSRA